MDIDALIITIIFAVTAVGITDISAAWLHCLFGGTLSIDVHRWPIHNGILVQ